MENRFKNYLDIVFGDMPKTAETEDIKSEMLQNLTDKYYDLVNDGVEQETAYNMTIASIGDIRGLFSESKVSDVEETVAKQKKRSAVLMSTAVVLYILCILPVIICLAISESVVSSMIGICLMFIMVAVATALIIYNEMTKYKPNKNQTVTNEFAQWQAGGQSYNRIKKSASTILWCCIVAIYFLLSFATMCWDITWIIFIVGVALNQILGICIDSHYAKKNKSEEKEKVL